MSDDLLLALFGTGRAGTTGTMEGLPFPLMLTSMGNCDTLEARFLTSLSIYPIDYLMTDYSIAPELTALDEELEFDIELENELKNLTSTLEMRKINMPQGVTIAPEEPVSEALADSQSIKEEDDNGWRIARQAMVRDFLVLSGRGLVGFGALLLIGFACFFAFQKLSSVTPQSILSSARQIFPVLNFAEKPAEKNKIEDSQSVPSKIDAAENKERNRPRLAAKPRMKLAKRKVATKPGGRRYSPYAAWSTDSPRGGDITYYDGTITEYTWH